MIIMENCYAGVVSVRGIHALTTDETLCKSFADEGIREDAELRLSLMQRIKKQTLVTLNGSACRCKYNEKFKMSC